jgi:hypothetical protein
MAAIITDQLRILNSSNFESFAKDQNNSLYTFIGLPNSSEYSPTWNINPISPRDSFEEENSIWDTVISLKRIKQNDIKRIIRKITWTSGTTYDMYRHDISRDNVAKPSNATSLYSSNYYVVNSDFKVYICLQNGTTPETPEGKPSLDEPNFTDLEPRSAGNSNDGYIWKYLYTIRPADLIKFDTLNFIPVPDNWEIGPENATVRDNASTSGQIKIVTIKNRGSGLGTSNIVYTNVPIVGDGFDAKATISIDNNSKVESIIVSDGGFGYTFGSIDLKSVNFPTGITQPEFDVIIPPKGGHGANIYSELGANYILLYTRIENNDEDFVVGSEIARIGIVENPLQFGSETEILSAETASSLYALKLTGIGYSSTSFQKNAFITQTIGTGITAVGRVVSYDIVTGVLKYWQDKTLVGFNTDGSKSSFSPYGLELNRFTATPDENGGSLKIIGGSFDLDIDTSFTGITTSINNITYNLGQLFTAGISNPEVQKYSGNIIYIDNRPSILRSENQKEDIKVILQF